MSEKLHDLTILYLQKSDISNLTPEQLFDKYNEVYNQMKLIKNPIKTRMSLFLSDLYSSAKAVDSPLRSSLQDSFAIFSI